MLGPPSRRRARLLEVHRFPNEPASPQRCAAVERGSSVAPIRHALDSTSSSSLDAVGIDAWGVDYALLGDDGALLENPYHYRDRRTTGEMDRLFAVGPRSWDLRQTGSQSMPINTLFQLHAACGETPEILARPRALLTVPDLFNYRLTDRRCSEYTIASTTQCVDPRTRPWARDAAPGRCATAAHLLHRSSSRDPSSDPSARAASPARSGTPVMATACHDTASAVPPVSASQPGAFISSGHLVAVWHRTRPAGFPPEARDSLNFTNEGGVCGHDHVCSKTSPGCRLLQACLRAWTAPGQPAAYGRPSRRRRRTTGTASAH